MRVQSAGGTGVLETATARSATPPSCGRSSTPDMSYPVNQLVTGERVEGVGRWRCCKLQPEVTVGLFPTHHADVLGAAEPTRHFAEALVLARANVIRAWDLD